MDSNYSNNVLPYSSLMNKEITYPTYWRQSDTIDWAYVATHNLNSIGKAGDTPLIAAALAGNTEAVAKLIELGANPNQPNRYGQTPISMAYGLGVAEGLLAAGANVNHVGNNGTTPPTPYGSY